MKSKLFYGLLSVVMAFSLWLYVITYVSTEKEDTYYNLPVVFQGQSMLQERGLMVTDGMDTTVTLIIHGSRADLNKLNASDITLIADLSKIDDVGQTRVYYTVNYPGRFSSDAFTEQKIPGNILLTVERQITKEVPVNVIYSGTVGEDFIVDKENAVLDYATVSVTGPEAVIKRIHTADIEVNLSGRVESFSESYRFTLRDEAGEPVDAQMVQTNVASVNLTLKIQQVKEIPLVYTLVEGGGATEQTSTITVDPPSIKISGSETLLESITELNIGTINLGEVTGDGSLSFAITLPNGITNLSDVPEATVTVQFPMLLTRTLTVTNITATGVPAGMEAEIVTRALQITLRGPRELVARMTEGDISVSVDFSKAELGTFTMKPVITLGVGYSQVGAMGTYSITATLREAVPEELTDETTGTDS